MAARTGRTDAHRSGGARLDALTWRDLEGRSPIVLVPVGSCEQHGPHLPLGTDTLVASTLAERAAARLTSAGLDAIVGPALTVTASGEHQEFPGTLSIGTDVMGAVIVELVRSADWSGGVVLVNGHGGNHDAVTAAVRRSTDDGRRALAWWPRIAGADLHAGRTETSILLAIGRAPTVPPPGTAGPTGPDVLERVRARGLQAVSPSGVLGDPDGASADEGHALLDLLTDDLVDSVRQWVL